MLSWMHVAQLKRQVRGYTSLNINFPITILTYNLSLQQTGSVVITSEKQLFTMSNVAVSYFQ
jgi:hypothetical protein